MSRLRSRMAALLRRVFPGRGAAAVSRPPASATGARGEDLAAAYLEKHGLRILARNYRARGGEIDIVAEEGQELVFVEVKTRSGGRFGNPEDAVDRRKAACLSRAAGGYWREHRLRDRVVRCDIVAVRLGADAPEIVHFRDAVPLSGEFM